MSIEITSSLDGITPAHPDGGFWEHWPTPPSADRHLDVLRGSRAVALAIDEVGKVVRFANAVGDGVPSAYIPLLEVLPSRRGHRLGFTRGNAMIRRDYAAQSGAPV